ncbi:cytochrome P450 [Actinospica sp. MGRD01-02]|uniref:Cytochrome P450 n=1 Tax=Actinospica acidithermotolerans TaxID=2828514 RepID=A0A941E8F0_9ACTN|nr:cytochrome P450 [Actinospica acidithermotolerans]MBR7825813.1 cytochrome P450 [Actinospica acidithermotolerans]
MNERTVLEALEPIGSSTALDTLAGGPRAIECPNLGSGRLVFPRYREVRQLMRDPRFLCAPTAHGMLEELPIDLRELLGPVASWILYTDPPAHARLRSVMSKAFTPRHISMLREPIAAEAEGLVSSFVRASGGDAASGPADRLPVLTISRLMGLDPSASAQLKNWSDDVVLLTEPKLSASEQARLAEAWLGLSGYFAELINSRRRSPGQDVVSAMVHAEADGARLGEDELLANCIALLVGGHETTSSLLSSLVLAAIEHRDARERVTHDPAYAAGFVEEVLRLSGPSKITARTAACEVLLAGTRVRAGQRVILLQASANRDPEAFADPAEFQPARSPNPHVGFGLGAHACFGAALARMQAVAFLRSLMKHIDSFELDPSQVRWKPSQVLRTPAYIPLRVTSPNRSHT